MSIALLLVIISWATGVPALLGHIFGHNHIRGIPLPYTGTKVAMVSAPIAAAAFLCRGALYSRDDMFAAGMSIFIAFLLVIIFLWALYDDGRLNNLSQHLKRPIVKLRKRRAMAG